jgi:hypothetical protein
MQSQIADPGIVTITFRCNICPGHPCTLTRQYDRAWYEKNKENRDQAHKARQVCAQGKEMDGHTEWSLVK